MIDLTMSFSADRAGVVVAPIGLSTPHVAITGVTVEGADVRLVADPLAAQSAMILAPTQERIAISYRYALGGYQSLVDRSLESQVVKLDIQWQSSARFDDVLKLQVETTHIGTTSYTLKVDISHQDHGQKIAVAEVVYVLVDAEEFKKLPIPDDIRQQLLIGAPDIKVNQAG